MEEITQIAPNGDWFVLIEKINELIRELNELRADFDKLMTGDKIARR